ncbi:MAG: hypothetical protein V3V56_02985, partial [bacterium]
MDWNSIYWPGGLPLWLIALLAAVMAESLRRRIPFLRERLSPACTYFLLGLRGLLYAAILFFLSGPTLIEERERVLPQRLLVLVDGSASMSLKDGGGGRSRLAAAVDVLLKKGGPGKKKDLLERLSEAYDLRMARFDTRSVRLSR